VDEWLAQIVDEWLAQIPYGVRFGWGPAAAAALTPSAACVVIVDVLSFTTSVSVAAEAGTRVFPYPWRDESAAGFARRQQAKLAVDRQAASAQSPWSLSPAALRRAPATAAAVGTWLAQQRLGTPVRSVAVIAAGERWPDDSLRAALEDLLGAGAIIAAAGSHGAGPLSPEATATAACFRATPDIASAVAGCTSGRELIGGGFADDVTIATDLDSSRAVPVLASGAFTVAT
jgi:2-phosphosulfolactate phosphatase